MSYTVDKAIFLRHYESVAARATQEEQEEAWRVYFLGQRASLFGETLEQAEGVYLKKEGKPAFEQNPVRRSLPGGAPHEFVLEVTVYSRPISQVFAGALLQNRGGKRHIELVAKGGSLIFRMHESSALLRSVLRDVGRRPVDMGFTELDTVVRRFSDDPQGFSALAEKDEKTEWLEVMPRAAVLARWGSKGERAARHL